MIVKLDLDPRTVWVLSERAEAVGMSVAGVLTGLAAASTGSMPARVRALWQVGLCDADIGFRVGLVPGRVAVVRRGLGLPANRRYRRAVHE